MPISIHPCRMCPVREGCQLRAGMRRRAVKSGAVSITYRCDRLKFHLRIGRRIIVSVPYERGFDPDDGSVIMGRAEVRATVTAVTDRYEFACVVDADDMQPNPESVTVRDFSLIRFRRKRKHSTIVRMLDEPDLPVCASGYVQRSGACDTPAGCVCAAERRLVEEFGNA